PGAVLQAPDAAPAPMSGASPSADSALLPRPPQALAVPGKAGEPDVPNPPDLLIETDGPNPPDLSNLIILRRDARIQAQVNAQIKAQVNAQIDPQVKAQLHA